MAWSGEGQRPTYPSARPLTRARAPLLIHAVSTRQNYLPFFFRKNKGVMKSAACSWPRKIQLSTSIRLLFSTWLHFSSCSTSTEKSTAVDVDGTFHDQVYRCRRHRQLHFSRSTSTRLHFSSWPTLTRLQFSTVGCRPLLFSSWMSTSNFTALFITPENNVHFCILFHP